MQDDDLVELEVLGVRRHPGDDALVVLLLEPVGELVVPITVGAPEAGAIATAQAGVVPPRPSTHDLLRDVLTTLRVGLSRVEITALVDGVFHAALVLVERPGAAERPGGATRVDARASDAIALAVRMGCPVMCATDVLAEVGVAATPVRPAGDAEAEVARFRAFLEQVDPGDFEAGDGP